MAKLRYGLTYIFLDNDLHFLEKSLTAAWTAP